MGIVRNYQVGLEILDDRVELMAPAGRKFTFPIGALPPALYGLVRQCIQDDQARLRVLEDSIEVETSSSGNGVA